MADLWADVTNENSETSWAIFEVEREQVKGVNSGVGLNSFKDAFEDAKNQWGVIKVFGVDQQDNVTSKRPKYVRVNWVGPKVPAKLRSGALSGKPLVTALLQGSQVAIDSNDRDELSAHAIGKALLQCGGAHKPTHYDFGGDEVVSLAELGYS